MEIDKKILDLYFSLKEKLEASNFAVNDFGKISYGIQFSIFQNNWKGVLRIFLNKKGILKIDYSQLHSDAYERNIKNISGDKTTVPEKLSLGFPIIGTDESGKGDYFGPLVSAGVYLTQETANKLSEAGVKDSKELSDDKNMKLSSAILELCKGRFSIIEVSPEKYNDLYDKFKREKKNLNTLLAWGHAKAIEEILTNVSCEIAISDQFADEKFILSKLQERGRKIKLIQMHKAEQNVAVAAASIIARARFLTKLSKISKEYKMEFPKGASAVVVQRAREFVKDNGKELLKKVAKLHFKTTKEVLG